jgi:Cyclic nucleotide-binding domain
MRVEATVTSMSWIPTDSLRGALKTGMDLRLSHWDSPLPDQVKAPEEVHELCRHDKFRFANMLSVWAEVEDGRIVRAGHHDDSGLVMGATTVKIGKIGATFRAAKLPVLRSEPEHSDGAVRFRQTVGGRTALPLPRPVPHPPYVRWQAPLVWTTLVATLRADGTSDVELTGASAFPRHWVYDATGRIVLKSGLADQGRWMAHSFGERTPWADHDREALVVAVESELERQLSTDIMQGGEHPEIRNLAEGTQLTRQGDPGDELYLVLDGVVRVDVDGRALAELGPGAVIGERALLEAGTRTSTVTATTPLRVAVASRDHIDLDHLRTLAESHHREDLVEVD